MGQLNITLPSMGEGITDATITKYLVNVGDFVTEDMPLVEVATDKVDSEVPSPHSGRIIKLSHNAGDIVPVGEILLTIESTNIHDTAPDVSSESINKIQFNTVAISHHEPEENSEIQKRFLSPLVKQLVNEYSLSPTEVDNIEGTGLNNRITKEDIQRFVSEKNQPKINPEVLVPEKEVEIRRTPIIKEKPIETNYSTTEVEIVEMDRMRKLIAEHMVQSIRTSPHVTSFVEIDLSNLVEWRNKAKEEFQKKHGEKLTFMPVFIESAVMALRDLPMVNVSVDGTNIIIKKNIHIGIATALPSGNLIVPVIKNADQRNLVGLAKSLNDLAHRARENKLLPDEIKGGTFTITNLGSFGTLTGTPIINQPEAAILAVGAIRKMPAVIETSAGDAIAIRHKAIFSLTFDHRVVDGALAGSFLNKLSEYLQNFDVLRKF